MTLLYLDMTAEGREDTTTLRLINQNNLRHSKNVLYEFADTEHLNA